MDDTSHSVTTSSPLVSNRSHSHAPPHHPPPAHIQQQQQQRQQQSSSTSNGSASQQPSLSKYLQLLAVIEDMGREIRPTYSGSKSSAERLKRGIGHARILVRECLIETERSSKS